VENPASDILEQMKIIWEAISGMFQCNFSFEYGEIVNTNVDRFETKYVYEHDINSYVVDMIFFKLE
jgi:hypothetical protein